MIPEPNIAVESGTELSPLLMDGFSVRARAAIELGQQSENALSFLDRKTGSTVDKQTLRGTAWPRDDAKRGAICQIIVRDTGFKRGAVLWRSVGLLVGGIGNNKDLHVVSTRAGFSDAFAAQYATCLFYKVDGTAVLGYTSYNNFRLIFRRKLPTTSNYIVSGARRHWHVQLVWESRTDSTKLFFPPADFHSPAPAMLSCATLDTAVVCVPKVNPGPGVPSAPAAPWQTRGDDGGGGAAGVVAVAERSPLLAGSSVGGSTKEQGTSTRGGEGGAGSLQGNVDVVARQSTRKEKDGVEGEAPAAEKRVETADSERKTTQRRRRDREDDGGGGGDDGGGGSGGGGGRDKKNSKAVTGMDLLRPYVIDLNEEISHAHPQILHLGETIHLFQPPEVPGGSWEEMQAVTWAIEQNPDGQVSVKYRVDPRGDRDMMEGCPLLKKIGGRKFVPVGLHLGRYTEKKWTHHGLLLLSGMHQIGECLAEEKASKGRIAEGRLGGEKLSYRKMMQERTKAHLSDVVKASSVLLKSDATTCDGAVPSASRLIKLSPEEGEALAEACEGRGVQAVLAIVLSPGEAAVVRRPGLKALARLASDNHQTLLQIGREGGIEAGVALLRELGDHRDVQENACWLLALLSQVAEFSRRIGDEGGCEEVCKVLKRCAKFGGACPRVQSWALGCVANLLVCRDNRRRLLGLGLEREPSEQGGPTAAGERGGAGAQDKKREEQHREENDGDIWDAGGRGSREGDHGDCGGSTSSNNTTASSGSDSNTTSISSSNSSSSNSNSNSSDTGGGLAGWIHTVLANSERVAHDRGAQYSGIACVREMAAAGPVPVRAMRSTGVPKLVGAALDRFGGTDSKLLEQAESALRCLSRD
ncbi:unnamed protein product [Pylaiella littoralis]